MKNPAQIRVAAAGALAAVLLTSAIPASAATPQVIEGAAAGNVVARAVATTPDTHVSAAVVASGPLPYRGASAVARAVTTGDDSTTEATTLQVLTAGSVGVVRADNTASATVTGDRTAASAVSIQLVAASRADGVTAANSAAAITVGCQECASHAVALQFIVVGGTEQQVSEATKQYLAQLRDELAGRLEAPAPRRMATSQVDPRSLAEDAARRAADVISADIGGTVQTAVDIDTTG